MIVSMWCQHDDVVGLYREPQVYRNDEEAKITYQRSMKAGIKQNLLTVDMLDDFSFRKICEFDDETGEVKTCKPVTIKVSEGDL